jgi:hypothetical protein
MPDDQQINPYVPPSARVEDSTEPRWYTGFRFRRALRWAFLTWLGTTVSVGILGGLAGFQLGHTYIPPSLGAALFWMWFAALTVSIILAASAFLIGLMVRIPAHQLARLAAPRRALGRENIDQAREVAAAHLRAPMYIGDYAKMNKISLDEVHREVKRGRLRVFWHDGIAFVDVEPKHEPGQ